MCEEKWEAQHTPRVCYFLKEAYTSNENGYNLVEDLHDCERPWTMWRKVAISLFTCGMRSRTTA